jgi:hypothetical protein
MASHEYESAAAEPTPRELIEVPATPRLADRIAELQLSLRRREWAGVRSCFHPEGLIESVASGQVLGRDDTVAAMQSAVDDGVYSMSEWTIEQLDDADTVLAWGGVRYRTPDDPTRTSDGTIFWLTTGRASLVWRVRVFKSRDAALEHLEAHGHTLGL